MTDHIQIRDKRRILEITAVLLTGIGKLIFMDHLDLKFPFITVCILGWGAYIWMRSASVEWMMKYWGFRIDNFNKVVKIVLPFGLLAILAFFIVGLIRESIIFSWHVIPILLIYPIWGVIQQFLVIALVAGNLQDMKGITLQKPVITVLTALLFGVIHYPYNWLMVGTFILALFYGYVYLKERNLFVLGLFHGWLGGLFYYTVVNRDPFLEVFGEYLY